MRENRLALCATPGRRCRMTRGRIRPEGAYYHPQLNEFVLPYEAVRSAASPEAALAEFVDSTYSCAASLADWDRAALEHQLPG